MGIGEQSHLASFFFLGDCSHFPRGGLPWPSLAHIIAYHSILLTGLLYFLYSPTKI